MIIPLFELYRTDQITNHEFYMVCKLFKEKTRGHDMLKPLTVEFPEEFFSVVEKVNLFSIDFNSNELQ